MRVFRTVADLRAHRVAFDAAQYDYEAEDETLAAATNRRIWPDFQPRMLVSIPTPDDPAAC